MDDHLFKPFDAKELLDAVRVRLNRRKAVQAFDTREAHFQLVVPKSILNKDDKFTSEEWAIMRQHPEAGAKMLKGIDHLKPAIPFVLYHHERWDGSGYPEGLAGDAIPLERRVMAIIDAYDALRSKRPYQDEISKDEALECILEGSRIHFDPYLVRKFLEIKDKLP